MTDHMNQLFEKYLTRTLSAEEKRELTAFLKAGPDNRREFAEHVLWTSLIRSGSARARRGAAETARRETPTPQEATNIPGRQAPVRRLNWPRWIAVAACLAIVAGALTYNYLQSTRFAGVLVARIKATAPNVRIVREGKTILAAIDMDIYTSDRIETTKDQNASFVYSRDERTELFIDENTILDIGAAEEGKRLRLETGIIDASVGPQPEGMPMIVTTPQAEAVVKGTSLILTVKDERTRLDVFEGLVQFTRLSDGKSVLVEEGRHAVAAEGVELAALPIPVLFPNEPAAGSVVPAGEIPKPATHLYGEILFEDEFDEGIDKWEVVTFTENPDPAFKDVLTIIDDGAEHLWAMNGEYRGGKRAGPAVSCVMIHPNVDDMVKQDKSFEALMPGLLSKEAIPARRFVVEIRYHLARRRRGGTQIGTSGINILHTIDARRNPKAGKLGTGWQLLRSEFRPVKGRPENVLLRHFFCGSEGDRYFGSALVDVGTTQVVFGVCNGTMAVDRVTVREMRDDPREKEGAEWK